MSSFGRKLRRAAAKFTTEKPTDMQRDLLMCGKALIERTDDVFEVADENVLLVVDLRDTVGAVFLYTTLGLEGEHFEKWLDAMLYFKGEPNPQPYMATWVPRANVTLEVLRMCGFGVPSDWSTFFDVAPPAGSILTLLKFEGRGQLMHVYNFEDIPAMTGPMVEIGCSSETAGAPAS